MKFVKRSPYIARRKTKIINNDAGNGTTGPKVRQSTQDLAVPYMAAGAHPQIDIRPGQAQVSKKRRCSSFGHNAATPICRIT